MPTDGDGLGFGDGAVVAVADLACGFACVALFDGLAVVDGLLDVVDGLLELVDGFEFGVDAPFAAPSPVDGAVEEG